jgi:hypothetical protein
MTSIRPCSTEHNFVLVLWAQGGMGKTYGRYGPSSDAFKWRLIS